MESTKLATSLFTCSVDRPLASYGKCSANITVHSCEITASSSQNSLPGGSSIAASSSQNSLSGGSFMEANINMKKALRGSYTRGVPGCFSNTKRDKELSFYKFPKKVFFEREAGQFYQEKGFYFTAFSWCQKSRQIRCPNLYFPCFLSPNRESPQKYIYHSNLQPKGRKLKLENQNP